ncbi:MAG: SPOR domain-containing protein [Flavobacteriaceae bacterium]
MQISQYISELLFRYDCVVVPGFGAFLSERVSAKIDKSSGEFFPPCKRISFNTQLKSNDGLLANHISLVEEITYENAISKIKKQVDYAIKSLKNSETIEFPNIGSLTNSKKGKITFEPTNKNNFLKDSFGLSAFISPTVTRENKKLSNKPTIALKTKKQNTYTFRKYAAIGIILLGLSGIIAGNIYSNSIDKHNTLVQQEVESIIENRIQKATFSVSTDLNPININILKKVGDFHIVAGAFRIKKNSERKLRELKRLGFDARLIGQNRYGLHQVVFESYNTRKDAENALMKIKKTQDKTAWLLFKEIL